MIVACGQTWLDQKIVVVDPESLTQCLSDQVGEIWVSGSSVARGYWRRSEETQQTFHAYLADTVGGPFLRTGDLGFLHNGELFVTGRLKDLVIIRGRNHYPQDIELTVNESHPALRSGYGAAFSVEVEGEERLVIAQEVERSYLRKLNVDEVVGAVREAVSQQHELEIYAILLLKTGSIPKTSSNKIQRHACRIGFLDKSLDMVGDWIQNPQSQIELQQLQVKAQSLWEQLPSGAQQQPFSDENEPDSLSRSLKADPSEEAIQAWMVSHLALYLKVQPDDIDIREPVAHYGLDSSVAISLTGELADWLGCQLEPTIFWEYPSIEALSQHLVAESQLSEAAFQVGVSRGV